MKSLLHRLARNGDIAWLSYYFAEFISSRNGGNLDTLSAYSAALVSEANLAGHVCVEFDQLCDQHLFQSSRIDDAELPVGPTPTDWRSSLQANPCVGEPGERSPLIIDGSRLYMNRFWQYEDFVASTIKAMLERPAIIDSNDVRSVFDSLFAASGDIDQDQAHGQGCGSHDGFDSPAHRSARLRRRFQGRIAAGSENDSPPARLSIRAFLLSPAASASARLHHHRRGFDA